jgi:outer membrane protein insertion porin family
MTGLNADALTGTSAPARAAATRFSDLEKTQSDMAFEATAQGYPFADVRPRINRDAANRTVQRHLSRRRGPAGLCRAHQHHRQREDPRLRHPSRAGLRRRRPLQPLDGERGKTQVEALGFFKRSISTLQPGSAADKVVISIVVEESTGDYGATAGYSTADQASWAKCRSPSATSSAAASIFAPPSAPQSARPSTSRSPSRASWGCKCRGLRRLSSHRRRTTHELLRLDHDRRTGALRYADHQRRQRRRCSRALSTRLRRHVRADLAADRQWTAFNKAWVGYTLTYDGLDDVKKPDRRPLCHLDAAVCRLGPQLAEDRGQGPLLLPDAVRIPASGQRRGTGRHRQCLQRQWRAVDSKPSISGPTSGAWLPGAWHSARVWPAASRLGSTMYAGIRPRSSSRSRWFRRPMA